MQNLSQIIRVSVSMAAAQFKARNESSYLGLLWYLLDPLAMFVIILLVRQALNISTIPQYSLYLLLGLIMFNFFRSSTLRASTSISGNFTLLNNLRLSPECLVLSRILLGAFSHLTEIIILIFFLLLFGVFSYWIGWYVLIFILFFLFNLGVGLVLATIGSRITDIEHVWSFLTRIIWFATPIFYSISDNKVLSLLNAINPLYYFITLARETLIYHALPSLSVLAGAMLSSFLFLILGITMFELRKSKFAEGP